jgi:hypothetical protein
MRTDATSLSRIILWYLLQGNANTGQLVFEIANQDTVRPLANLLVSVATNIQAVTNIAHITYCQHFYLLSLAELDNLLTRFMENISLLSVALSRCFTLAPGKFFPSSAPFLATRKQPIEIAMSFIAELLDASQGATCDDLTSLSRFGSKRDQVDFTQVATRYLLGKGCYS